MNVIERYYPLIDPRNGENDRNMGPELTREDLSGISIHYLALTTLSQTIQRTLHLEIRTDQLKLFYQFSLISLGGLFYLLNIFSQGAIKFCAESSFGICVNHEIDQMYHQKMALFGSALMIFLMSLTYFFMISDNYLLGRRNTPVTTDEIRNLGPLLSRDELNRMNLIQFSEAVRVTHRDDFSDLTEDRHEFSDRIDTLGYIPEEFFSTLFNSPQGRDFVCRFPNTCDAYREHLRERLRPLEQLLNAPADCTVDGQLSSSQASSSSPIQISVISRIEATPPSQIRKLLKKFVACRSYISQTKFETAEEQTITAHILHFRPLLISHLSRELAFNVITYFVISDLIHDVKTLLELRPDVEKMDLSSLILTAAHHNRTNILKYLLNKMPNDSFFSRIIELLIKRTSPHRNSEMMHDLFDRLIDLPSPLYPSFNLYSDKQIAEQFRTFIREIFPSLSSSHFASIKRMICLIRYTMHLINQHELKNREISPQYTVEHLLSAILGYIQKQADCEPHGIVEDNLNFVRGQLPIIREFLQTGRTCQIPDENFPELFKLTKREIIRKLRSL